MHILRGKIKRPIRIYIAEIMPTNVVGKQKKWSRNGILALKMFDCLMYDTILGPGRADKN